MDRHWLLLRLLLPLAGPRGAPASSFSALAHPLAPPRAYEMILN
jgi:hypothetical protein